MKCWKKMILGDIIKMKEGNFSQKDNLIVLEFLKVLDQKIILRLFKINFKHGLKNSKTFEGS